jgi:hypothetical protein
MNIQKGVKSYEEWMRRCNGCGEKPSESEAREDERRPVPIFPRDLLPMGPNSYSNVSTGVGPFVYVK